MEVGREGVVSALTCQGDSGRVFELYNGRELRLKILAEKILASGDKVPISGTRMVLVCRSTSSSLPKKVGQGDPTSRPSPSSLYQFWPLNSQLWANFYET
jgi:hypothetical protein